MMLACVMVCRRSSWTKQRESDERPVGASKKKIESREGLFVVQNLHVVTVSSVGRLMCVFQKTHMLSFYFTLMSQNQCSACKNTSFSIINLKSYWCTDCRNTYVHYLYSSSCSESIKGVAKKSEVVVMRLFPPLSLSLNIFLSALFKSL